jgi:hypothetical protein
MNILILAEIKVFGSLVEVRYLLFYFTVPTSDCGKVECDSLQMPQNAFSN